MSRKKILSIHDLDIYPNSGADMWKNRALYDKSMKLGTWPDK